MQPELKSEGGFPPMMHQRPIKIIFGK